MATYEDIQNKIWRAVSDPSQSQVSTSLMYDAVCMAHDALLPWVPRCELSVFTAGSDGANFALPADLYQIDAVQDTNTGLFIPKATLAPRGTRSVGVYADNDWAEYPTGTLTLARAISEGQQLTVYYRAYWTKPANEDDTTFVITVPSVAIAGLIYWACAHCQLARSTNASFLAQFKTRVDSGNPEDNPLEQSAKFFLNRFQQVMNNMPPYTKVVQG